MYGATIKIAVFNLKCTKFRERPLPLNMDIFFCPYLLACSRISYGEFYSAFFVAFTLAECKY